MRGSLLVLMSVVLVARAPVAIQQAPALASTSCNEAGESPLPLPSTIPPERLADYEKQVLAFLKAGTYVQLGWCGDKGVRDTGPWINNIYYGTHKAVRVYYSPGVMRWLTGGRNGAIPDGAMIIKEQFTAPAARYAGRRAAAVTDWTIMIKDAKGSEDGWFWGEFCSPGRRADAVRRSRLSVQLSGRRLRALLHALPRVGGEGTDVRVAEQHQGFPGDPLTFRVDDTWRDDARRDARAQPRAGADRGGAADAGRRAQSGVPPDLPLARSDRAAAGGAAPERNLGPRRRAAGRQRRS